MSQDFEIKPVAGRIGAEIDGVDLAEELDDETVAEIRVALLRWKVLFFRDQHLDPDSQARFGERFGPLTTAHPTVPGLAEHPEVLDVDARNGNVADALRNYAKVFQSVRYETVHPVVRVHPETGERALLLGGFARNIIGFGDAESAALLRLFRTHVEQHENIVRWRWRAGDVAFWDNRSTQHRAIADFGASPRRLHRVTIAGDVPIGVDGRTSTGIHGDSAAYTPVAA